MRATSFLSNHTRYATPVIKTKMITRILASVKPRNGSDICVSPSASKHPRTWAPVRGELTASVRLAVQHRFLDLLLSRAGLLAGISLEDGLQTGAIAPQRPGGK